MPSRRSSARQAPTSILPNVDAEQPSTSGKVSHLREAHDLLCIQRLRFVTARKPWLQNPAQRTAGRISPGAAALPPAVAAKALRSAAAAGDLVCIRSLLQQHPHGLLNMASSEGATALMQAARQGHLECVAALLAAGSDPNLSTEGCMTACMLSASGGHLGCLEALLEAGADPNAADCVGGQPGRTAVHIAADNCDARCLRALLAAGGNAACRSLHGSTPLIVCCSHKSPDAALCAQMLLTAGADVNARNSDGRSPVHQCIFLYGRLEALELLLSAGADPNAMDAGGNTPLHKAAHMRAPPELVRALVLAGARLDCANRMGLTPLQLLCKEPEVTSHVLSAVEEQGVLLRGLGLDNLDTPVHRAVACNQPGLLRALLTEGASPEVAASGTQATPLVLAAQLGHEACVRELLAASADPGSADCLGNTAAYYAAASGHWHCLRSLLSVGASCDQQCEEGRTALHAAALGGHEACMLALLEAGAAAAIDAKDHQGLAAVQLAAIGGHDHCVCTLLMAGAALPSDPAGVESEEAVFAQPLIKEVAERMGLLRASAAACGAAATEPTAAAPAGGAALDDTLRSDVCCPITHEVMENPVIAADGTTYERQAIAAWIARQQAAGQAPTSPITNLPLEHTGLTENRIAKALIGSLRAAGLLSS